MGKMVQRIPRNHESPIQMANPTRDMQVGDIVCLRDEPTAPTKWPLARVIEVHPEHDGIVRVVTVGTAKGQYKRTIVKLVPCTLKIQ